MKERRVYETRRQKIINHVASDWFSGLMQVKESIIRCSNQLRISNTYQILQTVMDEIGNDNPSRSYTILKPFHSHNNYIQTYLLLRKQNKSRHEFKKETQMTHNTYHGSPRLLRTIFN